VIANGRATIEIEEKVAGKVTARKYGSKRLQEVEVPDKHAEARVDIAHTKNLGNYESLRIGVSVSLPCAPEDVELTVERAKQLSETYLAKFLGEALGAKREVGW